MPFYCGKRSAGIYVVLGRFGNVRTVQERSTVHLVSHVCPVPRPDCVARRRLVQRLVRVNRIRDLLRARAEQTPNQDRDCVMERATPA
jgi:hypothetical protein